MSKKLYIKIINDFIFDIVRTIFFISLLYFDYVMVKSELTEVFRLILLGIFLYLFYSDIRFFMEAMRKNCDIVIAQIEYKKVEYSVLGKAVSFKMHINYMSPVRTKWKVRRSGEVPWYIYFRYKSGEKLIAVATRNVIRFYNINYCASK